MLTRPTYSLKRKPERNDGWENTDSFFLRLILFVQLITLSTVVKLTTKSQSQHFGFTELIVY